MIENPSKMEQAERITSMERLLEQATHAVKRLTEALDEYEAAQESLHVLETYYNSEEWKQDFASDEAGQLPKELKRGVLSEDAIWNLLDERDELIRRLKAQNFFNNI